MTAPSGAGGPALTGTAAGREVRGLLLQWQALAHRSYDTDNLYDGFAVSWFSIGTNEEKFINIFM